MTYKFLKSKSSYGRIFGVSILTLVMLLTAIFALVVTTSDTTKANFECGYDYDFGDAPDPTYPTLNASDGARHVNCSNYFIGSLKDSESDGQPTMNADGDDINGIDDEDGVSWFSFKQGHMTKITVATTVPVDAPNGNLSAWIDFNADGDWADFGEQILSDVSLGTGIYEHWFTVPCSTPVGNTYMRFRFSTDAGLSYDGAASDGEVEDYKVYVWPDDEYPSQTIEFGGPKIIQEWQWQEYYVIGPYTPVWINSSDMCPGSEKIEYSVWVADDLEDPIVWTFLWNKTVYDQDETEDMDETYGSIVTEFYLDETCLHEVRYQCWDYDGATEGFFSKDFFVDKCSPITTKVVGCPKYSYGWPPPSWISGITPLTFNSVDDCCLPNGTAVDEITIKVWWKAGTCDSSGAYILIDTIVVEDGDPYDINPIEGRVGYEFHFEQTGYYELEYWGVDMMGNVESHHKQQHRVDVDPPEITKTYPEGGYCEVDEHQGYIKCCSPINLTVEEMPDDTCNAGLYGMFWRYEWNDTYYPANGESGAVDGQDIVDELCIVDSDISPYWWYPYDEEIHFLEECVHDLYYFAIDNVGNYDDVHHQIYYVDNTPPIATKEVGEPKCQNELPDGDWCITSNTPIWINVTDDGTEPCIVGAINLYYRIWYDGEWEEHQASAPSGTLSELIYLEEDCMHYLEFYVEDCVGNRWPVDGYHNETFYVDNTPPIIIKSVGEPNCWIPDTPNYCVNLSTLITIETEEIGCCQNDYITIEYKIWYDGEETDWMPYEGPFSFEEECEHVLTIRAYDCLGNGMDVQYWDIETFYVDETPPEIIKTVGEPKCEVPGTDDWCVTTNTLITLDATNSGCCDYGEFTFKYRTWFDGEWTEWMEYEGPFTFDEECMHYLEVLASDCLDNIAFDNETFYVDDSAPEIIKTVGEPKCPVPGTNDWCVTTDTLITLEAYDEDCCPNSTIFIKYRINYEEWQIYTEPFSFDEECQHVLEVMAYDCLGNGIEDELWDVELFYVDDSPPEIIKTVGEPKCPVPDTDDWCVTTDTLITLEAENQGCCENSDITIEYKIGEGSWQTYTESFSFDEECEHVLTVRAYDCLGNGKTEEHWDIETFYVDETPPEITKTVGEPKCPIPGTNQTCVTTKTEITLDASNKGCCPSEYLTLEYRIWFDGAWTDWTEYEGPFSFEEECMHYLEVKASDCLGNTAYNYQTYYVDETPPEITKTVGEPKCPIPGTNQTCVTTKTEITLDASNKGCCPSEYLTLEYRIWFDGAWTDWTEYEGPFSFEEECMHYLEVKASDCLGNTAYNYQTYYVDETPPEITKTVGEPKCPIPGTNQTCITTKTEITLDASNKGCCPSEYLTLEYRIWFDGAWTDWTEYEGPFSFEEECMHYLEVKASDCLGNTAYNYQTYYVDETPPEITKTVGEPKCPIPDTEDYCITTETEITLEAEDLGCCNFGDITIEYQIWYEGQWTDWIEYTEPISFDEECEHVLRVRAYDCLGNGKDDQYWDTETFYVDETPPEITKTVGEPKCPIPGTNQTCVTTKTEITLDASNKGCCPSEYLTLEYRIWFDGAWTDWTEYEGPFSFEEECMHYLEVKASDCLGNTAYNYQTYYVDETPPLIIKEVGEPNCPIPGSNNYCVNLSTIITLDVEHQGCCQYNEGFLEYRIWSEEQGWTDWMIYEVPFSFEEECMHYLETRASDCLGNEAFDNETFYVDEQAPELIKEVGDPHFYLGLDDYGHDVWMVYAETDICFEAIDMGCCESGDPSIFYRIWYLGTWSEWMLYEECINLEESCVHYLEAYAIDCIGNAGEVDNETFWVCGPGGGGDPNIEIMFPEHGSTQDSDEIEVIIFAEDIETDWEDLEVYLWIPGGRRDAPFLYYEVEPIPGEENYYHAYVPIYFYQDGAYITLEALALDEDGNTAFAVPVSFYVDSTIIWDQWMQFGWNPLPLNGGMPPGIECNETLERVLYSIEGHYDWVFYYDESIEDWISYYTGREYNELTSIDGGQSYWVHITKEEGLRYYISLPEVEILNPEDEDIIEGGPDEINGTAQDSESGISKVEILLYYEDGAIIKFWNGSGWTDDTSYLLCDLDSWPDNYEQDWSYDCSEVAWIEGLTYYVYALAYNAFDCYATDMISFSIPSECQATRTYTTDEDFDEGILDGVEHETVNDQLQLIPGEASTYDVMWIANAGEASVSKWDTQENKELARYKTFFYGGGSHSGPAPSRTCVDSEGNCYVANRQFSSNKPADVIKILTDDWIDRNGNGVLDTSYDENNDGYIDTSEMLPMVDNNSNNKIDPEEIQDERIAWAVEVGPDNGLGRSLAIDLDGNIWLGCYNTYEYYKISGVDGSLLEGPVDVYPNRPYGALVDKDGILWGSSLSSNLLELNTNTHENTTHTTPGLIYGIALSYDSEDNTLVYMGARYDDTFYVYNTSSGVMDDPAALRYDVYGIAADLDGNIYAGDGTTGKMVKFAPDGSVIWNAPAQLSTHIRGTVVDAGGDVWSIHLSNDQMCKFNGSTGGALGVFDTGDAPYTYSDATGIGFSQSLVTGKWTVIHDSEAVGTDWDNVDWTSSVPEGTTLTVKVRSSEDKVNWSSWEEADDGVDLISTPAGRYIQIEVSFKAPVEHDSPILYDLTVNGDCNGVD